MRIVPLNVNHRTIQPTWSRPFSAGTKTSFVSRSGRVVHEPADLAQFDGVGAVPLPPDEVGEKLESVVPKLTSTST